MNFDEIQSMVKLMLSPKRFIHSKGVVAWAEILTERYHGNIEKARIAAITHDCAKELGNSQLLNICKERCIPLDEISAACPQLLHGVVGCIIAKEKFDINDEETLNAIKYHTIGRASMSLLEKIIYLSDMIEEGRVYPGVEEIREKALKDLDAALLLAFDQTIKHVLEYNGLIHMNTIEGRNYILLKRYKEGCHD